MINYISTRGSERALSGAQAIIEGIADDKGLYMPTVIPALAMSLDGNFSILFLTLQLLQLLFVCL